MTRSRRLLVAALTFAATTTTAAAAVPGLGPALPGYSPSNPIRVATASAGENDQAPPVFRPCAAHPSHSLRLFGAQLKGARRATLERVLRHAGLGPVQVGKRWWSDRYTVNGQLKGASKLTVGYTARDRFAFAEYTFPSFMDTELVKRVIAMVQDKYGAPDRESGDIDLGSVSATWNVGDGMQVEVTRGWPDTTTYLNLEDVAAYNRMQSEIHAQQEQQQRRQAKAQSNAF